jgi:hypothetical protein
MAYEATKVFAIRKMKTQFTNKNTHILRQTYYRSVQFCRKFLNLESLKCHFVDFEGSFDRILMVRIHSFSMSKFTINLLTI